ncbi:MULTISPECIES: alpha/beta hydrolase family protein [unclassified Bacillus (in: firmicutes)]|uniref:alpha/beta hydrolase family protein n=1 Tax=unclassified Bacillus (in: firmicutes) TaxID=185979 RepID=UPI00041955E1|nr:dienelactone hydrolase [Bacillus sp. NSP9.1]QHZ44979.1 dienelactone hydrolase [Bacillus sp. NSP9.1]
MRLFEVLLLLSNTGVLLSGFFRKKQRRIAIIIGSGIALLFLVIHWATEGLRVQLLFPYALTVLFFVGSIYGCFKKNAFRNIPRHIYVLCTVMLMLTAGFLYAFPVFQLPKPTGEYQVGTQTFHFVDSDRDEIFDEVKEGKRELMVQVWYPAKHADGRPAPFMEGSVLKEEPLSKTLSLPSIVTNYLTYIQSHSYEGAEIADNSRSYPLIILNHGYKSSRFFHTSQAENLASHGYIVASIDHTYSAFATAFPDGRMAPMKTDEYLIAEKNYRDKVGKVWTDDIKFVLDQFERINAGNLPTRLKGSVDMNHIGVFGHSFGGAASYDASYDSRVTAGIDLDGGLYRYHNRPGSTKPFLFMFSESTFDRFNKVRQKYVYTDKELKTMGATREEIAKETKDAEAEIAHFQNAGKYGGHILYVKGMEHYNFADVQFFTPFLRQTGMTGQIDPLRAASIVNAYTLSFFDKHLKNKSGRLLEGPADEFPEVKFADTLFDGRKQ